MIWFGIEDAPGISTGGIDWAGLALITDRARAWSWAA